MIELKPGDVFASQNPQGLGKAICLAQSLKSQDGKAEYGHTGIIQSDKGLTFEALWKIGEQDLFTAYKGQKILIARWVGMTPENARKGFDAIVKYRGRGYPFQRLIFHALGLARWVHFLKTPVCSELTALFLIRCGAVTLCGENYWGVTPDNLVDEWRISDHFEVVAEEII